MRFTKPLASVASAVVSFWPNRGSSQKELVDAFVPWYMMTKCVLWSLKLYVTVSYYRKQELGKHKKTFLIRKSVSSNGSSIFTKPHTLSTNFSSIFCNQNFTNSLKKNIFGQRPPKTALPGFSWNMDQTTASAQQSSNGDHSIPIKDTLALAASFLTPSASRNPLYPYTLSL